MHRDSPDKVADTMRCPNCSHSNTTASLLCAKCGHSLLNDQMQATVPILDDLLPDITGADKRPAYPAQEANLALFVTGQERPLLIEAVDQVLLGRLHPEEIATPTIDYDLAAKAGVSRRHALIAWTEGNYTITDLESTNGTRLNGKPLLAHMPYVLNSGDQLRLGMLIIYVYFKEH